MRLFNQKIWTGTACATEVFTDPDINALLGSADLLAIHAHANRATGTTTKLLVNLYHSADNKNWILLTSPAQYISATLVAGAVNDLQVLVESLSTTNSRLGFVRLGILCSGSTPEVDVELYATGRAL